MLTALISFFLGVFLAPMVRPLIRPFVAEVLKLFVTATHEVRTAVAKVKEEVEDAVAATEAERAAKHAAPAQDTQTQTDAPKREP